MDLKLIHEAVSFATEAHEGQIRKTSQVAYISHPLTAALYAQRYLHETSFSEEEQTNIVAAIILHDVWEDTEVTLEQIEEKFGSEIRRLVKGASEEDKTRTWMERKTSTINKTANVSLDLKYVICADKVHNLVSMAESKEKFGEDMWKSFKTGKSEQKWYYMSMYEALIEGMENPVSAFFQEMKRQVDDVFGT